MRISNAIGRFFAEEWQQALKNEGVFYTPAASSSMSLPELQGLSKSLSEMVNYWINQVYSNTSPEAIANAQAIADLQQSKLNQVTALIAEKEMRPGQLAPVDGSGTTATKKSWLPVALVAGLAYFLFIHKKRKT